MAGRKIKILGVHGLGHQKVNWFADWEAVIRPLFPEASGFELEFKSCFYDPIFEANPPTVPEMLDALWKLGVSGGTHALPRERGLFGDVEDFLKWKAGYVVDWVSNKDFQRQTRALFLKEAEEFQPDIILAHSLGSLITYNAITHADAKKPEIASVLAKAHYVTFGSQINNPFVISNLSHGRVEPLAVAHWWHLFNKYDPVFTARISLSGVANFTQIDTPSTIKGVASHDAALYLRAPETVSGFWIPYAQHASNSKLFGFGGAKGKSKVWRSRNAPSKKRRALLVGINDYIDPANRLEGCVNDVFSMSATLQECGFAPEDIRTCLDRRATAGGILERLEWLLEDVSPGDERVFYYSGHGAQMPIYGAGGEPDRKVETLVPCDFDWTPERAITDQQIFGLYSQLPYDTRLAMIFDCCHSGGIHRQGGDRARGITPPDDIRHRQLKWDIPNQMWVSRDFKRLDKGFARSARARGDFFGQDGSTVRLGRGAMVREHTSETDYNAARRQTDGPVGPYLPLIIEACGQEELSYEYRHGATSYGAFTYCLTSLLREKKGGTFTELVAAARTRLADLRYPQTPQVLGPAAVVGSTVPWQPHTARHGPPPSG